MAPPHLCVHLADVSAAESHPAPANSPTLGHSAAGPLPSTEPGTPTEEHRNIASPFPDSSAATQLIHSCTDLESDEEAAELEDEAADVVTPTQTGTSVVR